jgi:tripartite-type tricarboxylate transporter receptor subunit TctC
MSRLTDSARLLFALIAPALILALAGPALADPAWPTRSVRMIVPFPAGSANDAAARVFADGLAKRWGKPVVVDNKPGGDASIGTGLFASTRDDHTLLYGTSSIITINPLVQSPLPYDAARDLVPISAGASAILVVAVHAGLPARSLGELVALVKEKPGTLNWGSGPSLPFYAFSAFVKRRELDMVHVPYKDAVGPQTDLGAGRIQVLAQSLQGVAAPVKAGTARIIAVIGGQRVEVIAAVPSAMEAGFPELELEGLSGLFGWRDMPPVLRDKISSDMLAVARDPAARERIEASGQRILGSTPAEFEAAIDRQRGRVHEIAKLIDLKPVAAR